MQFTVTVDDSKTFAITFARTESNKLQSAQIPDPSGATMDDPSGAMVPDPSGAMTPDPSGATNPDGSAMLVLAMVPQQLPVMVPNPNYFTTDEDYMISRNAQMVESYVKQAVDAGAPSPAPPPPSPGVTGQVTELPKWKVLVGLARDGIKAQVLGFIATMSDEAQALWDGATAVQRDSPLFGAAKTAFGWTDAMIDDMFTRYSQITMADITA